MILKLLFLFLWMIVVPVLLAALPVCLGKEEKEYRQLSFLLPAGTILFWALMQLITVPFVLSHGNFHREEPLLNGILLVLCVCSIWLTGRRKKQEKILTEQFSIKKLFTSLTGHFQELPVLTRLLWGVFTLTVLFQLFQSYTLAYADGDDAYYLPISTVADLGGSLYTVDSYTGAPTVLDVRYGLAPFPIWVAYLANRLHVNVAVAAHSLIPLVLIPITYLIYLQIGKKLFGEKKTSLPLFMLFVSLLQIFGNYSIYPASTFLLTRTRQGKAALGNVILPFLFLLLFELAAYAQKRQKASRVLFWFCALSFAACFCSTMSAFLVLFAAMLAALLFAVAYRNVRTLPVAFLGCFPCLLYAGLYFALKSW